MALIIGQVIMRMINLRIMKMKKMVMMIEMMEIIGNQNLMILI